MLKSILQLIKKDLFGRQRWFVLGILLYLLFVFPIFIRQGLNNSPCFISILFIGLAIAFALSYSESIRMVSSRYNKVGIVGILPVTRLEIIVSRYVACFAVIALVTAAWGLIPLLDGIVPAELVKIYDASPTMLVLSMLLGVGAANVLLLLASVIQSTTGLYLLSFFSFFFAYAIGNITTFILSKIHLSISMLVSAVAIAVVITVISAMLNYSWYKTETL